MNQVNPISNSPEHTANVCPICSEKSTRKIFETETSSRFSIVKCKGCALVYATPRPTPAELDAFYSSDYFEKDHQMHYGYSDYRTLGEINARRMWSNLKVHAPSILDGPHKLLDVGCATGGFLDEATKDGWDCTGVELSQHAVDIACNEFGLNVIRDDIMSSQLQPGFGLITMWHVLEHLIDPLEALERARELLVPGGFLLIELPNWNSVGRTVRKTRWSELRPPEHINYFIPSSLSYAVEKAGLEIAICSTHYPSLMDKAAIRRRSQPLHKAVGLAATLSCSLGRGGYLRILVRRPSA